jgi:Protein of unknown function (DUF3822)
MKPALCEIWNATGLSVSKIYYFAALKIMAKILFDISAAEQAIDWQHCHLVMEVSQHIFSYAVMNAEKQAERLRIYQLHAESNRDLAAELEEIIFEDEVLKEKMKERIVMYNFPDCHLVPEKYFHADTNKELIELLHGDLNKGAILSEKIDGWEKYNVFRVPLEVHNLFQRGFANGRYWHYYSLWMKCGQKEQGGYEEYITVLFYPNRILVAVIKNKQLQLLQSFSFEVVEDVAFYLLTICNQLELSPENIPVKLSGMIDESSALYTEIFKYFGHTVLDDFPAAASSVPAFREYPSHFFSPLLKLATCVS